jgi:hypothetical protein
MLTDVGVRRSGMRSALRADKAVDLTPDLGQDSAVEAGTSLWPAGFSFLDAEVVH